MTDQHPITPHRELIEQWASEKVYDERDWLYELHIAHQAARWGADQELRACCVLMDKWGLDGEDLVECRRPKPPSLKEQALKELESIMDELHEATDSAFTASAIRRALEQLDD